MRESEEQPAPVGPLVAWWENLTTRRQIAIAFPISALLLFAANLFAFQQPLPRSIFYGSFEGAVVTVLVMVATATEKSKRKNR